MEKVHLGHAEPYLFEVTAGLLPAELDAQLNSHAAKLSAATWTHRAAGTSEVGSGGSASGEQASTDQLAPCRFDSRSLHEGPRALAMSETPDPSTRHRGPTAPQCGRASPIIHEEQRWNASDRPAAGTAAATSCTQAHALQRPPSGHASSCDSKASESRTNAVPSAPRKPCPSAGCPELLAPGQRRCTEHGRQHEQTRGSRQERGYDRKHDELRRQWAPMVATGSVVCPKCQRRIQAGTPWDLGHTDDRTTWTGPEHAACNRSHGGRRAHRPPTSRA